MRNNLVEPTIDNINKAVDLLKAGGVVVLPTDTNYNVFTSIHSHEGVKRIFAMKNRNHLSPLSLCFEKSQDVLTYANVPPSVNHLIKTIWPASISFIVHKNISVPDYVTCNFPTVAIACHQHPVLAQIIKAVGEPLAGTSANLSGTGLVKDIEKVYAHIGSAVDLIINGGQLPSQGANTIIDCSFDPPVLARSGDFLTSEVKQFIPDLQTNYSEEVYKTLVRSRFFNMESK
jgi:L-threonylcarbamoyladenylate synthase